MHGGAGLEVNQRSVGGVAALAGLLPGAGLLDVGQVAGAAGAGVVLAGPGPGGAGPEGEGEEQERVHDGRGVKGFGV